MRLGVPNQRSRILIRPDSKQNMNVLESAANDEGFRILMIHESLATVARKAG